MAYKCTCGRTHNTDSFRCVCGRVWDAGYLVIDVVAGVAKAAVGLTALTVDTAARVVSEAFHIATLGIFDDDDDDD